MSRFLMPKKVKGNQKEYDPIVFGRADLDDYLDEGISSKNVDTEVELFKNALDFSEIIKAADE